jgi:hypothetical protein
VTRGEPNWHGTTIVRRGNAHVIAIKEPTSLAQVIGWLKFTSEGGDVVFRGQASLHADMLPSGARGRSARGLSTLNRHLREYIDSLYGAPCRCIGQPRYASQHECLERSGGGRAGTSVASGTYRAVVEPLLQHYGLRTRWIDVVDNVWVALWFGCHRQVSRGRYAYHLKRSVPQEGADAKVYIAAVDTGPLVSTSIPGYRISDSLRVADLRYSVPSYYLRPHAQHGLLVAPRSVTPAPQSYSMAASFGYYIEIGLGDALDWLGSGVMTSAHSLFPSAVHDEGYRRLTEYAPQPPDALGAFTIYGPGL